MKSICRSHKKLVNFLLALIQMFFQKMKRSSSFLWEKRKFALTAHKFFGQVWGNLCKSPSHLQKLACPYYTYDPSDVCTLALMASNKHENVATSVWLAGLGFLIIIWPP